MTSLEEAPAIVGHGINVHGLVTFGIAAVVVLVGWKIFQNLSKT
jgi:hypothetical protein